MRRISRRALALGVPVALAGCANRATVTVSDGRTIEARLVGSDAETIHLERARPIERVEIVDIDHPGNGMMTAGGILTLMFLPGTFARAGSDATIDLSGVTRSISAVGVAAFGTMTLWGATQYFGSVSAANEIEFGIGPGSASMSMRF